MTYSTSFEFKHSINSRKSLLKGIGVRALAKLAEDIDALLRGHFCPCECVGSIGFLKAVENLNGLLHHFILA